MISLNDWITSSGKYPERASSSELTEEVKTNAQDLLNKVNKILSDLNITGVKVSSGFRPSSVNSAIPNAAKKSAHMSGKAIDLVDVDGKIDARMKLNPKKLKENSLFLEDPEATKGWCHLDCVVRPDRASRMFKP